MSLRTLASLALGLSLTLAACDAPLAPAAVGRPHPAAPTAALTAASFPAGPYASGEVVDGRRSYVRLVAGTPIVGRATPAICRTVFVSGHGGTVVPTDIPMRETGSSRDERTLTMVESEYPDAVRALAGCEPWRVMLRLSRFYLDYNRDSSTAAMAVDPATGELDWEASIAFGEMHRAIRLAVADCRARTGLDCFIVEQHAQSHTHGRTELGWTRNTCSLNQTNAELNAQPEACEGESTLRRFSVNDDSRSFAGLLRGSASLGAGLGARGYPTIPSPEFPRHDGLHYYYKGYTPRRHMCGGSRAPANAPCGLQLESPEDLLTESTTARTAYVRAVVRALDAFLRTHLGDTP